MLRMTIEGSLVGVGRQMRGCCRRGELQGNGEAPRTWGPAKPREAVVWLLAELHCSVPLEAPGSLQVLQATSSGLGRPLRIVKGHGIDLEKKKLLKPRKCSAEMGPPHPKPLVGTVAVN